MNIYVIRHGQTDYNLIGKFQGQVDIPLNENGIAQAQKSAKELSEVKFDAVFSSPLKRALKTAQIVTTTEIKVDNRIIERSFGLLEGKTSVNDYENKIDEYKIETIKHLQERVYSFLSEIITEYKNCNNILIATHACTARMIECYFTNKSYNEVTKNYKLGNGEYKKYTLGG